MSLRCCGPSTDPEADMSSGECPARMLDLFSEHGCATRTRSTRQEIGSPHLANMTHITTCYTNH